MIRERKGTKIGEKLKVVYFCFAAKWIDSKGLYFFSKHQDARAIQFRSLKVMPGYKLILFSNFSCNSWLSASNFKGFPRSLEHFFFLTVGQNNFGNRIPFLFLLARLKFTFVHALLTALRFLCRTFSYLLHFLNFLTFFKRNRSTL